MLDPVAVDALVAALDDDEPPLGARLAGQVPPPGTSLFRPVDGIDDHIVPEGEC